MSDNDSLVDRANALITRRRSFVAAPPPPAPVAEALLDFDIPHIPDSPLPPVEDDLPVLTEVVDLEPLAPIAEASLPAISSDGLALQQSLVSILAADLSQAIEQRLALELPGLVENALSGLRHQLQQGIGAATEAALKDFMARRQLPSNDETSAPHQG